MKNLKSFLFLLPAVLFFLTGFNSYSSPQEDNLELVKNGKSSYKIVISKKPNETEKKAASELQNYIKEICGAKLRIKKDNKKISDKEIILGENDHLIAVRPDINLEILEEDGFSILTSGEKLIIVGGKDKGLLYGVYCFLEKYLGCRLYSSTVKKIPEMEDIVIGQIRDTQVPVIKFREDYYTDAYDPLYSDWHKLDSHNKDWGFWVHTFFRLVPPEEYFEEFPEYFSMLNGKRVANTQLCLSDTNVLRIVVQNLKEFIDKNPGAHYWSVSQNDTYGYCQCPECSALDEKEGSPSGSVISFVNKVAAEFPDKTISTLAYQYSRSAPRNIIPAPNVNIMLCTIECNRSEPISSDPSSSSFRRDIKDWGKLTNNIIVWDYVVQFRNLVSPFPNLNVLQPNIQFFVENNTTAMFQQGNREVGGEFAELRTYLIAKLLWDPYINIDSVMNDFLYGYYEDAGPFIRDYIDIMHETLERSGRNLEIFGSPVDHINGYLSIDKISKYNSLFDQAEQAVINDPSVLERVKIARLPLDYAMLEISRAMGRGQHGLFKRDNKGNWIVKPEIREKLYTFVERCNKAGITRLKEWHTTPDDYLEIVSRIFDISMIPSLAMDKRIATLTSPGTKYSGGDPFVLVDGLRGTTDWYYMWLGYEKEDMEVVIDLGEVTDISNIKAEFLQDIGAWIFMPEHIVYSGSIDGENFFEIETIANDVPQEESGVIIKLYEAETDSVRVRYIKVFAKNMGFCPDWHIGGGGGKSWIFVDEIIVN